MKTVGLICEGVSELNVLETILTRFLGESYVINPIQPETRVENGVRIQEGGGGWSRVISLCNSVKRKEILEHNDYLVIQLDSDACDKHFEMFGSAVYDNPCTVISREFSTEWAPGMEPFYTVSDERNTRLYARYKSLADQEKNVLFGGHLAEYKYYDMAPVIERAREMYQNQKTHQDVVA